MSFINVSKTHTNNSFYKDRIVFYVLETTYIEKVKVKHLFNSFLTDMVL